MSTPAVAVLIRGSAADAAVTVRAVRANTDYAPRAVYLVLDGPPAEALNQAAAVRGEPVLAFLDAGLAPARSDWLTRMVARLTPMAVGGVVGTLAPAVGTLAGLVVRHDTFDLLGGFDADRHPDAGFIEDFLARLIGLGSECVAADGVEFLAGSSQLFRGMGTARGVLANSFQ